jgi:cation diffusion facilitator family transporter
MSEHQNAETPTLVEETAIPSKDHTQPAENEATPFETPEYLQAHVGHPSTRKYYLPFNLMKKKRVEAFYERQKELEELFEQDKELTNPSNTEESKAKLEEVAKKHVWLTYLETFSINFSFFCNICLFLLKLTAAIITLSISVIASTLDSFLDLLSGTIIFVVTRIRNRKSKMDFYNFPVGKSRIEPIGIIIFASVMATASLQVIKEAVSEIIAHLSTPNRWEVQSPLQRYVGIAVLGFTIVLKSILYLLCRFQTGPSVTALADDHRNDVISNSFVLVAVAVSEFVYPEYTFWLDPAGAIVISFYIFYNWVRNMFEYAEKMVGKTADPVFIQRLVKLALDHSPDIIHVERVSAFYVGLGMFVEMDLVLHPDTSLKDSHDLGEKLQNSIEKFEEVERCFVHLDYETTHKAIEEHKLIY